MFGAEGRKLVATGAALVLASALHYAGTYGSRMLART